MKRLEQILIFLLVSTLLLVTGVGNAWSVVSLPTANFSGNAQTTAGVSTGTFVLVDAFISQVNYLDGTAANINTANETIIGKTVTISGATRTGDYTFTDAIISISDGSFNYLTATLSNITFITDGTQWYLNPGLDINNPSTLNLSNIILNTDATHPSRYIDEFKSALVTNSIGGMKIILWVISGSISGDSFSNISAGLIDGVPPIVEGPSGAKSVGYWKNHDNERETFINSAVSYSTVFTSDSALRYYLTLNGKKPMIDKAKQQLAAFLLNIASSLNISTVLNAGELEILQLINPIYGTGATVGDALTEIENSINGNTNLEHAKDLADEINNRDEKNT